MGKKRAAAGDDLALGGHKSQWWCYYCNKETKDEESLVRHQQAVHFKCTLCGPASPFKFCQSVSGLVAHVRRSHKMELTKVPGAIEGRDDVKVDVFSMRGIPQEHLPAELAAKARAGAPVMQPPPPSTPEGMLAMLEMHKQAEAKRQKEAAEAATAAQATMLLAAAVGAGAGGDPSGPSLAAAALGAIGSLSAAAAGASGAPLQGLGEEAAALPSALMMWGKWRHSAGGEVTVTPGLAGLVIVSHAVLGELTVPLSDFLQGSRVRFVEREGTLDGNLIRWSNGTSWVKVL